MNKHALALTLLIPVALFLWSAPAPADDLPTACDLLAAHPLDPARITDGVPTSEVMQNLATAEQVCRRDLRQDPDNTRLQYNLGRVLFYAGQYEEGFGFIAGAAQAGHRQAQFVEGLIRRRGQIGLVDADICATLSLWLDAALRGHFGASLSLARDYLTGKYKACQPPLNRDEIRTLVEAASEDAGDYFQRVLIDLLRHDLAAAD